MLDYVRQIEQETGLTLLPALLLLIVAFIFHQLRRNQLQQAKAAAADPATKAAEHRAEELELLVTLGQTLGRALDFDSIRVAVSQHLPTLAGTKHVCVLVLQGPDWVALHGNTQGADEVVQWSDLAASPTRCGARLPSGRFSGPGKRST